MKFHQRLRQLRQAVGINQTELAAVTGISQVTISRLETGRRRPTLSQLQRLADVLRTSMDDLMGRVTVIPSSCDPARCPHVLALTTVMRESAERLAAAAQPPYQEVQP
jgi:transcriptional regulator with XRE-family HTH domain